MDLVSYALATLSDTKLFLGTTSLSDDQIKMYINFGTDLIESLTGRRLKSTSYVDQVFDGNGEKEVLLPQYPVTAFVSLGKNGAINNSGSWETLDEESYWRIDNEGRLVGIERFTCGNGNYRASYTAGYTTIPYDLQFACMRVVQLFWYQSKSGGISSERLGDHQVTFDKGVSSGDIESDPLIAKVISKYRKPNL